MVYDNPILPGMYPDPSVCAVGGDYYLVTSTFEYLPGIPVLHSRDLVRWTQIGHALHRPEQMEFPRVKPSHGIWAPTIRHHAGRFYIVATLSGQDGAGRSGNFLLSADDPAGPWSQPVPLAQGGIDPSLFFDGDTAYLTTNRFGEGVAHPVIQQSVIDVETGALLTPPRDICAGTGGSCTEAPHMYRRGDWYYLVCAEGGTALGHMVTVFRAASPWGPFEGCPANPILTARDDNGAPLQATGHADFITDAQGRDWMVFLCYRHSTGKHHHLGRETALLPVDWPDGGWPTPYGGRVAAERVALARGPSVPAPDFSYADDFAGDRLDLGWNFLRGYLAAGTGGAADWDYRLADGGLLLRGREASLRDRATPAFIARRQRHFACEASVQVDFAPTDENEAAGLAVRMTEDAHYALVITRRGGGRVVAVQRTVGDMCCEAYQPVAAGPVRLCIRAGREAYRLGILHEGGFQEIGAGLTRLLSTETNGGFVGVYIGLYATGNGRRVADAARFEGYAYCGV